MSLALERGPQEECLATWWQQATPGTSYWRTLVPARHLPGQAIPLSYEDVESFGVEKLDVLKRQRGAAIWQFLGDFARSRVALGQQVRGVRTLMEVDDNYLRMPPLHKSGQIRFNGWKEKIAEAGPGYSHEAHRLVSRDVDGMICSTEYLADVYSEYNPNVYVCPNSIDPEDWKYDRPDPDGIFRIVYYGSISHLVDAPLVTKALKWAAKQKDVEIYTVGFRIPSWSFPHEYVPWEKDPVVARESLFQFDLGIAPLKENPWSKCKSDVKALEYAMAGVLPLMSRVEPFRPWFRDFPRFTLGDDDWIDAIQWAVRNQDEVRAEAQVAKAWVLTTRTIQDSIHFWREALDV